MKALKSIKAEKALAGKVTPQSKTIFFLMILVLLISGCYKETDWYGQDGRQGDAYLSLSWIDNEPAYIDAGTSSVPAYFYWNEYYRAYPGYYTLYYDGEVWMGNRWAFYAWEVDYEIWRMQGEQGGMNYNGRDGEDTYITLECSPFGPMVYEDLKSGELMPGIEILQQTEDSISIQIEKEGYALKATYRKVKVRE
jgi:hypothetical protein